MKALLVLIGLVAAAGAGAAGGALIGSSAPARMVEPVQPQTQLAAATGISKEAQQRLDSMSMEIAELQSQLAALRQQSSRAPAVAAAPAPEAVAPESPEAFASLHRAAILKVIDDQKAEEERKREEERKAREVQQAKQHADRVATKVPLSEGQKQLLAQFYQDDRQKLVDMKTQMRDISDADGTPVRDAFREMREWHTNELTRLFGTELGAQIDEADSGNWKVRQGDGQGGGNGARPRRGNGGNNGGAGIAGQKEPGGG